MSHENFFRNGWGVLQLLRRKHASLVPILGKHDIVSVKGGNEAVSMLS